MGNNEACNAICEHTMTVFTSSNAKWSECSKCDCIVLIHIDCHECGAVIVISEGEHVYQDGKYFHYHCTDGGIV
jgi:hypothetical protein